MTETPREAELNPNAHVVSLHQLALSLHASKQLETLEAPRYAPCMAFNAQWTQRIDFTRALILRLGAAVSEGALEIEPQPAVSEAS